VTEADPGDHPGSGERQFGCLSEQRLPVGHGEEVCPELVDLGEQPCLGGRGEAEHGHDGRDTDGYPECGQCSPYPTGAQPDAGNTGQIGGPKPRRLDARIRARRCRSLISAKVARFEVPRTTAETMRSGDERRCDGDAFRVGGDPHAAPCAFGLALGFTVSGLRAGEEWPPGPRAEVVKVTMAFGRDCRFLSLTVTASGTGKDSPATRTALEPVARRQPRRSVARRDRPA